MALEALYAYGGVPIKRSPAWQEWAERADRYAAPGTIERVYADLALAGVRFHERHWAEYRNLCIRAWTLAKELGQPDALMDAGNFLISAETAVQHQTERIRLVEEVLSIPRAGVSTSTLGDLLARFRQSRRPMKRRTSKRMRAQWRSALAILMAPAIRSSEMAKLRSVAMT